MTLNSSCQHIFTIIASFYSKWFIVEFFVIIILYEGVINLFSERLKELRKKKGLTQEEVSKKLDIARTTYSGYERGVSEPDFNILHKISNFFEVDSNWLFGQEKENVYTLSEKIILKVIREAEEIHGVSLQDDPIVESAVRDLLNNLAKMKKANRNKD